ncbi:nascent polypeptide-associated complex subunit alpha, muscle-specific form-like [Balaenoptera musculus]|uniref:Nascent polypeptide-associated complex subunit alpha, muscle-specific form-like n=1 Tax=Balaenoptera musculus TaxID=9771 RepID=A0A8B8WXB5_BALMU|nr:nascent polypeptide-associated complex subunit alpha, muscle-specific form-like [Balaenoptera musculus]
MGLDMDNGSVQQEDRVSGSESSGASEDEAEVNVGSSVVLSGPQHLHESMCDEESDRRGQLACGDDNHTCGHFLTSTSGIGTENQPQQKPCSAVYCLGQLVNLITGFGGTGTGMSAPRAATPQPGARRCLPPAAVRVSPREPGGWRAAGERRGAGSPAAPPRAPLPGRQDRPPPRRARLRLSSRLCNVSSRGGGGGGRGPAVAASAARPGGRARREPAAASLPSGRCGRLGAPRGGARTRSQPGCGRSQRTADTRLRGAARRDRPGDGPPRRVPSTLPLPGRLEPEPERAPSYDGGDPAAGERACCPLGCATAAGARGGPRRAPLSGRRSPPPRAPRAPALGLRGQEPRGAPRRRRA